VYSVNAREFMPLLTLPKVALRVEVGDNEIQTCVYALLITNRK